MQQTRSNENARILGKSRDRLKLVDKGEAVTNTRKDRKVNNHQKSLISLCNLDKY